MNLLGGPAADIAAAVQENFQQADDPRLVDFDAGIADRADGDGQGDSLQQRKVHVDVEPLGLEAGEAVRDGLKLLAHGIQMVQALLSRSRSGCWSTVRCAGRWRTSRTV